MASENIDTAIVGGGVSGVYSAWRLKQAAPNKKIVVFEASNHKAAPWYVLKSDDKKRARLNGIKQILSLIPYKRVKRDKIVLPKRSDKNRYRDGLDFEKVKLVREVY